MGWCRKCCPSMQQGDFVGQVIGETVMKRGEWWNGEAEWCLSLTQHALIELGESEKLLTRDVFVPNVLETGRSRRKLARSWASFRKRVSVCGTGLKNAVQWFWKIKSAVFRRSATNGSDSRPVTKRTLKKSDSWKWGAKIRISLQKMPLVFLKWKKRLMTEILHGQRMFLKKTSHINPKAAPFILTEWKKEIVGFVDENRGDRYIYECCCTTQLSLLECSNFIIESIEKIARALDRRNYAQGACRIQKPLSSIVKVDTKLLVQSDRTLKMKMPLKCCMHYRQKRRLIPFISIHLSYIQLFAMAEALVMVQENYRASKWWVREFPWNLENPTNTCAEYGCSANSPVPWNQSVLDEATITNIVIAKDYQGKGLAQRLWQMALYDLKQKDVKLFS